MDVDKTIVKKVTYYGEKSIYVGSYLGGPLAAIYMLSKNEKSAGDYSFAKKITKIGIVFTILLLLIIFIVPEQIMSKIPKFLIPLTYSSVAYYVSKKRQKDRWSEGSEKHKWYKVLLVSILGLAVFIVLGLIISLFLR